MAKGAQVKRKGARAAALPGRLLPRSFFEGSPELVGPRLLGKLLVHRSAGGVMAGRIVEVEAYLGPHNDPPDPAAHAHRGPTPRNLVLFGPAGHAYVYSIYGRYFCMNISCESESLAGCVLLRALEPVAGAKLRPWALRGRRTTPSTSPVPLRLCKSGTMVTAPQKCSSPCASASSMRSTRRFGSLFRNTHASPVHEN